MFLAEFKPENVESFPESAREWVGWRGVWEPWRMMVGGPKDGAALARPRIRPRTGTYGAPCPPDEVIEAGITPDDLVPLSLTAEGEAALIEEASSILENRGFPEHPPEKLL